MRAFTTAACAHTILREARETSPRVAEALWNAILGLGPAPPLGSYAEAVQDTTPLEHVRLLLTDEVAAAYAFAEHWPLALSASPGATPFQLRERARLAWAPFVERATRAVLFEDGFGWDASSAWAHLRDVELRHADLDAIERIARLASRMHVALRGARARRVAGVPPDVHSVERGSDVARLLPSELVALGEPLLELTLLERLATRKAAQYAVRGEARAAWGPLVVALDESGSMHGARNEWAKAATVALARTAWAHRRTVTVVHYATSTVVHTLGPGQTGALLEVVSHFLSGGTDTALGIARAGAVLTGLARSGQGEGDLVLVTDGVDGAHAMQAAATQSARRHGARLWTVAIECAVSEDSPLRTLAAGYARLGAPELADPASVLHLAAAA